MEIPITRPSVEPEWKIISERHGDKIIIMSYAQMEPSEIKDNKPKVVFVDDENKITRVTNYEKHGKLFDLEK